MTTSPTRPRGKMNNSFSPEGLMSLPQDSRELVERRERLLGPAYRLFYNEPVHFSKGKGARLWDADGA
jgi:4-aminobutyrate aminotransferase-like enzyme